MRTYRIAEWMSSPPIVIPATTTLADAQHLMERRQVRRLPVTQDGRLMGIVTWGDLRAGIGSRRIGGLAAGCESDQQE